MHSFIRILAGSWIVAGLGTAALAAPAPSDLEQQIQNPTLDVSHAVELRDFFTSRYFDTKEAFEKRKKKPQAVFPRPQVDTVYVWSWVAVLVLSLTISFRDRVLAWLCSQP